MGHFVIRENLWLQCWPPDAGSGRALHSMQSDLRGVGPCGLIWRRIRTLDSTEYDGVAAGAGPRIVPRMTPHFGAVMNTVEEHAPQAKLAFNTDPEDSVAASERS